jgi:polyisoprenoid-binding protein YceI
VTAPRPAADVQATRDPGGSLRRRWPLLVLGLIVLGIAAAWLGISYLVLGDEPAPVGLAGATASPSVGANAGTAATPAASAGATAAASSGSGTTTGSSSGGLDGSWKVDPSVGSFSDFSGSFVGYRVEEELANVGAATAVGRTPDVTGSLAFAGTTVSAADFTADLTTLQSDKSQRDGQLHRQALETDTYPTATFKLTQPIDLGSVPADGQVIQATATGDLTIHGVTKPVQVPIQARLSGDVVTVTGSTTIVFADYGMSRPRSFMVLSIADHGIMEFQLQFTKG